MWREYLYIEGVSERGKAGGETRFGGCVDSRDDAWLYSSP